jgi:hypothetical protein
MKRRMDGREHFPPEKYLHWTDGCRNLASLANLQSLQIDMIIWDELEYFDPSAGTPEQEALVYI